MVSGDEVGALNLLGFSCNATVWACVFVYLVGTDHDDSVGVDYLDGHVVILMMYGTGQKRGVKKGSGSC